MATVKIQIKPVLGKLLFEYESENNTVRKTLEKAIDSGANLHGADLYGANLYGANLYGTDLYCANLRGANLGYANLGYANLRGADLYGANLHGADLYGANLYGANLHGARLHGARLYGANLRGADLRGADLRGADLRGANLRGVKADVRTSMYFPQCPDGEFIGWKKASGKIVKLLIFGDSKRSSATTLKCRCSKAKVLDIQELDGSSSNLCSVKSDYADSFIYEIGETAEVADFDNDRWDECSTGIHFFISREMAVMY